MKGKKLTLGVVVELVRTGFEMRGDTFVHIPAF